MDNQGIFDFVDELLATAEMSEGRPYCSLMWLKRLKQASARPQAMIDLEHLP